MSRLALVSLLIIAVSGLYAQEDGEIATVTQVGLATQDVFRGVKQSGAGAEGTFQVARGTWRVGVDFNQPFDRNEPEEGDLHAAYAWKVSTGLNIEAIVTQRWFSGVEPGVTTHSFEAGLTAGWTLSNGFSVEIAGFHDLRLRADTLHATVNYSMPLKSLGAYLEWNASIGTVSARDLLPDTVGAPVRASYCYYAASVRLPYRIGAHTTLVTGLHVAESDGQSRAWSPIAASGGLRAWADVGLNFDF
jgi:hypothetical protein